MDQRANFLALILLDALEDENKSDVYAILDKNNVDASFVVVERGIAPLHYSCGMENEQLAVEFTKRFLERGANPNVLTSENMTPLHVAAMYGRVDVVRLLLHYGGKWDIYDDEHKMPVNYAIEEGQFEVVQIMRDHIFLDKCKHKRQQHHQQKRTQTTQETSQSQELALKKEIAMHQNSVENSLVKSKNSTSLLSATKFENSLEKCISDQKVSTPINKKTLLLPYNDNKSTPSNIYYNFDVASPYYIYITHRRNKPQPKFPPRNANQNSNSISQEPEQQITEDGKHLVVAENIPLNNALEALSPRLSVSQPVNIFALTKENLAELSLNANAAERSRISQIALWREKVQHSRARKSILQEYEDEEVLNLEPQSKGTNTTPLNKATDVDSGACGSTSSVLDDTEYAQPPNCLSAQAPTPICGNMSLGQIIQRKAQAHLKEAPVEPKTVVESESSYHTVPDPQQKEKEAVNANGTLNSSNFIRSPNNSEFFMQMAEVYMHTDDEEGLAFYETKLVTNQGNKVAQQRMRINGALPAGAVNHKQATDGDTTATSQSTNITIPADYETDALRAELTTFGEPPGPITKSTKRIYLKRLIKYKRQTATDLPAPHKQQGNLNVTTTKFSVELFRTVRSPDTFQAITDYTQYETQSTHFFAHHQHKRQMREGHLKQSFIYMLIDPRISCNLPGESVFLEKFVIWKRFLESIFYVGKGKTSRPYSHLYEAIKAHSRLHGTPLQNALEANGKKISIKKQALNIDLFKIPSKKSSNSRKLDRILDIWSNSMGVVCLHVFHNIMPTEAYTREAAVIDALSLQHLTNAKRGDYYGPAKTWSMREKKYLGIALLYKAMQIYLAEGESQLSPCDLI